MGIDEGLAHGSLRLTAGHATSVEDVDLALDAIRRVVPRLLAAAAPGIVEQPEVASA
jgi:cysteine sulfinate desulfinase/cysteine desulfurase-like protein